MAHVLRAFLLSIVLLTGMATSSARAEDAVLGGGDLAKRLTGNTLEYVIRNGLPFRVWIYHPDGGTAYVTSERQGRRPLQTTWRIDDAGHYCYSSQRFGERCFIVRAAGNGLTLEMVGRPFTYEATIYEGDAQRLVARAEGQSAGTGTIPASHPSLAGVKLPRIIPISELYNNRLRSWGYKVSPDGKLLAWIARTSRGPRIHVRPLAGGPVRVLRDNAPLSSFSWAMDSRRIIFFRDTQGDENFRLNVADVERPDALPRELASGLVSRFQHRFRPLPDDPAHILAVLSEPDKSLRRLYRVDIQTGAVETLADNPGEIVEWVTDWSGGIAARYRRRPGGGVIFEVPDGAGWRVLARAAVDESFNVYFPPAASPYFFAVSNIGRDKRELVKIDRATGKETLVAEMPDADIDRLVISPERYRPLRAEAWGTYKILYLDPALQSDMSLFERDGPALVRIVSADRKMRVMVVSVTTDVESTRYYLFDRRTKMKELLADPPLAEYLASMSPQRLISYTSRDGLTIHGLLTIPKGTSGRNLPMVVRIHGGPVIQDTWGFSADDQFFANRGYAVLRINYRGSPGYGKAFLRALKHEAGRKMHNDIVDGVKWAVAQGIADPAKIAIYGRSFGGYATLIGLTMTPKLFAAGIDIVGVSDLVPRWFNSQPDNDDEVTFWTVYMGDPSKPEERADMAARSPINFVDRIERPLLVFQGANDRRVNRSQSDRLVAAMRAAGKPVEYTVFDNEGHQIRRPANHRGMMLRIQDFLARILGGRSGRPPMAAPFAGAGPGRNPPQLAAATPQ